MAHSVDPDEEAHYELLNLDLCCLGIQIFLFLMCFYDRIALIEKHKAPLLSPLVCQ